VAAAPAARARGGSAGRRTAVEAGRDDRDPHLVASDNDTIAAIDSGEQTPRYLTAQPAS